MFLLVGLGNIGKQYINTRHNVGFEIIDYLVSQHNLKKIGNKLKSIIFKGNILDKDVLLLKPTTMMNSSGDAVRLIKKFYKISNEKIFVFHDELDLETARVKFKFSGSSAGHNGIKNIDQNIGNNYFRIRVGINNKRKNFNSAKYVLNKFDKDEALRVSEKIILINKHLKYIFNKDIKNFMNIINS